ncbi:MAG: RnfABCDGE type electron transport complex subunit D, partial [Chloroflexota bacterium]|nr:RnfABCDGE type electron transport complex subunit D [Chloroflexota bacterium]
MISLIDNVLDRITLYRLVLCYLIFLLGAAVMLSAVGVLGYDPFALLFTIGVLLAACSITNWVFAKAFGVPANAESTYISALILALIITPLQTPHDLWFLGWAAVWAMASKYIVAIGKKHIFNPVAFAVALTYLTINQSASWWVGSAPMLPFVLAGGILLVRKLRRSELVWSFLLTALATVLAASLIGGDDFITAMQRIALLSPLFFFAFVILTEPVTTPPTQRLQIIYGVLVGFLFAPQFHLGDFYTTPEIAIVIGNIFSFFVSSRTTLVL